MFFQPKDNYVLLRKKPSGKILLESLQKPKPMGFIHHSSSYDRLGYICFSVGGFVTFVICVNVLFSTSSVTWRKNNVEMRSGALQLVKAEGEKHSLVIKQMSPKSAGSYCVTAVNAAGSATCSATLYIQSGEERDGWCHCDTSTGI